MKLLLTSHETDETFVFMRLTGDNPLPSFEQQLSGKYGQLSAKLKQAADFVLANPIDVASRSLRSMSKEAQLSPATFSRMSVALGYASFDELRGVLRQSITHSATPFSDDLEALQQAHGSNIQEFVDGHLVTCVQNLTDLRSKLPAQELERCTERFHEARHVHVLGALGSTGAADYLCYMAGMIADNWRVVGRPGASVASDLVGLTEQDVLIVITKPPFATQSLQAVKLAAEKQAFVVVITDTHRCPALTFASASFIVPTGSPHFFSSYTSTFVLSEILIGMLAARSGEPARERIEEVENQSRLLDEVWDGQDQKTSH